MSIFRTPTLTTFYVRLFFINYMVDTRYHYFELVLREDSGFNDTFRLRLPTLLYLKSRVRHYMSFLYLRPCYAYFGSRDCDLAESTHFERFPTYWHMHRALTAFEDIEFEGPHWSGQCSESDYLENNGSTNSRDYITEAWENGDGFKVQL